MRALAVIVERPLAAAVLDPRPSAAISPRSESLWMEITDRNDIC